MLPWDPDISSLANEREVVLLHNARCKLGQNELFLLVLTTWTPWSYEKRDTLRNTWGSYKTPSSLEWKMVFNIGLYSAWWDSRIRKEVLHTMKNPVVDASESTETSSSKFLLHSRGRTIRRANLPLIYIRHIPNLVKWLQSPSLPRQLYAGVLAIGTHIDRLPCEKHFLSYEIFNATEFPTYARGLIYILLHDLLPRIFSSISRCEPLRMHIWVCR